MVKASDQNLVDCNFDSKYGKNLNFTKIKPKNSIHLGNWGCNGGTMATALGFINSQGGISAGYDYRYQRRQNDKCHYDPEKSIGVVTNYTQIESGNETALLYALAEVGPIAIAIDAGQPTLHNYKSGV